MPEHTGDDTHGTRFALDRHLLRRRFDRAAATCDGVDLLAREIARRMDERLDYIRVTPRRVLDLGCGTGADLPRLAERFPVATLIAAVFSPAMVAGAGARIRPARSGGLLRRLLSGAPAALPHLVAIEREARAVRLVASVFGHRSGAQIARRPRRANRRSSRSASGLSVVSRRSP